MFFQCVVAMQFHPGQKAPMSVTECARYADMMMEEFLCRMLPEEPSLAAR